MPAESWGWRITKDELRSWILEDTERWLVLSKPGNVVCHPSKYGPWSSLIGACREYLGLERLHMPFRLDRETSGVILFAKDAKTGSLLQRAVTKRNVRKIYHTLLVGERNEYFEIEGAIGKHPDSPVLMRRGVVEGGSPARTLFRPLAHGGGCTLVEVEPLTGRMHQIRAHASHAGYPILGDKIYGPDDRLYIRFLAEGMTPALERELGFRRQALHCTSVEFRTLGLRFQAPLAQDMSDFIRNEMNFDPDSLIQTVH